ncbi:MAG: GGDEF domain-containing protein [Firmicutes bacterium]|nr:GGDEF domain-containing protein [Bacillota bacterium]
MVVLTIGTVLVSVISSVRAKNRLKSQNQKYQVLAHLANEYLYEYNVRTNDLQLSEKYGQLFVTEGSLNSVAKALRKFLLTDATGDSRESIIELPLDNDRRGFFRAVNHRICDHHGRTETIIGKLIDISEAVAERDELLFKSQVDGLTGVYNAATTRDLILKRLREKDPEALDAFIIIDCDDFKRVNDTHGHLVGDQMLERLGNSLKKVFRKNTIIGRLGGDEFCVYWSDVPSLSPVYRKCRQFSRHFQDGTKGMAVSVSIGVAIVKEGED